MMSWKAILLMFTAAGAGGVVGFFIGKKTEEKYWIKRLREESKNYFEELDKKNEKLEEIKKQLNKVYGLDLANDVTYDRKILAEQAAQLLLECNNDISEVARRMGKEESLIRSLIDDPEQVKEEARRLAEHNRKLREEYVRYTEKYVKHDDWDGAPVHVSHPNAPDPAESMYPSEDDETDDILKEEEERDKRLQEPGDHCVLITPEEMSDLPGYTDYIILFYYEDSDVLTEENGTLIDYPELVIGDCIERSGFRETSDDMLLVWNQEHRTIYEISKVPASYEEPDDWKNP